MDLTLSARRQGARQAAPPPPPPVPAATRSTRATRLVRGDQVDLLKAYQLAFPKLVFYFDSLDQLMLRPIIQQIRALSGTVEPFFSAKVTHVVVPDSLAPLLAQEQVAPTAIPSSQPPSQSSQPSLAPLRTPGGHSGRAEQDLAGGPDPRRESAKDDIIRLARGWGMRIWTLDKLVNRLLRHLPGFISEPRKHDAVPRRLVDALQRERVFGVSQVQQTAPSHSRGSTGPANPGVVGTDSGGTRADVHYFKQIYVLVEDVTSVHRPIIMREYALAKEGTHSTWPKLYVVPPGQCPFVRCDDPAIHAKLAVKAGTAVKDGRDTANPTATAVYKTTTNSRPPTEPSGAAVEHTPVRPTVSAQNLKRTLPPDSPLPKKIKLTLGQNGHTTPGGSPAMASRQADGVPPAPTPDPLRTTARVNLFPGPSLASGLGQESQPNSNFDSLQSVAMSLLPAGAQSNSSRLFQLHSQNSQLTFPDSGLVRGGTPGLSAHWSGFNHSPAGKPVGLSSAQPYPSHLGCNSPLAHATHYAAGATSKGLSYQPLEHLAKRAVSAVLSNGPTQGGGTTPATSSGLPPPPPSPSPSSLTPAKVTGTTVPWNARGMPASANSHLVSTTTTTPTTAAPWTVAPRRTNNGPTGLPSPALTSNSTTASTVTTTTATSVATTAAAAAAAVVAQSVLHRTPRTADQMAKLTTHRRRVHASAPAKKPGYCENCHAKYEDLYAHVKTTAHQTFARNPVNYTELDVLLSNVARPHRPQPPPAAEAKGDLLPDVPGNHRARTIADAAVALGMPPLLVQLRLSCRRS